MKLHKNSVKSIRQTIMHKNATKLSGDRMTDKTAVKTIAPLFPVSPVGGTTCNNILPVVSTFNSIYICKPLIRQNIFEIFIISGIVINFNMHPTCSPSSFKSISVVSY